jgi:hypothetical protein
MPRSAADALPAIYFAAGAPAIPAGNRPSSATERMIAYSHAPGQIAVLGKIADAPEDFDAVGDGVQPEHTNAAVLGPEQPEQMLDQRRLARAVFAHQSEDAVTQDKERDVVERPRRGRPGKARSPR